MRVYLRAGGPVQREHVEAVLEGVADDLASALAQATTAVEVFYERLVPLGEISQRLLGLDQEKVRDAIREALLRKDSELREALIDSIIGMDKAVRAALKEKRVEKGLLAYRYAIRLVGAVTVAVATSHAGDLAHNLAKYSTLPGGRVIKQLYVSEQEREGERVVEGVETEEKTREGQEDLVPAT